MTEKGFQSHFPCCLLSWPTVLNFRSLALDYRVILWPFTVNQNHRINLKKLNQKKDQLRATAGQRIRCLPHNYSPGKNYEEPLQINCLGKHICLSTGAQKHKVPTRPYPAYPHTPRREPFAFRAFGKKGESWKRHASRNSRRIT